MSSSAVSGGVGDEAAGGAVELVVEGDAGCEGEEALKDACPETVEGAGAVAFEREEVFERLEDRFDALADWGEVWSLAGLVSAARADDQGLAGVHRGLEVAAGVVLVADHGDRAGALQALDQAQADLALVSLGAGQRDRPRGAIEREEAVQPEAPEVAAVAAAVPVVGRVGELAAANRFDRARALNWGRIDDEQIVVEAWAQPREVGGQRFDEIGQTVTALP